MIEAHTSEDTIVEPEQQATGPVGAPHHPIIAVVVPC
jgi:hypothetical protein